MKRKTMSTKVLALSVMAAVGATSMPQLSLAQTGFTIEEITVTARKREESLQDTPLSVTAVTGDALELRQVTSSDRLGQVTPNLTFDSNAPTSGHSGAAQIYIRGIGQQDFLGVVDPGVGVYVDGVYYARTISTVFDFLDVDRIEVLRGPQGTLFGRNTIGGAIAIHSRKPTQDPEGDISLKVGSDSLIETRLNVSGPLSDTLAARLTLGSKSRDGYVTRLQDGVDLGDDSMVTGRLGLVWTPSDDVEVSLSADYMDKDENGAPLVFGGIAPVPVPALLFAALENGCAAGGPAAITPAALANQSNPGCPNLQYAAGPFANNGTAPTTSEVTLRGFTGTVEWDINDNLTFKSITGYREMEALALRDADNTPLTIFHSVVRDDQEQFSQEFQLLGNSFDDRFQWILGLYYFDEEIVNEQPLFLGLSQSFQVDFDASNEAFAVFAQGTWNITDQLSLTAGLRYTDEEKTILPDQRTLTAFIPGGLAPNTFFVPNVEFTESFDDVTPMANLAYQWNDEVMTYVSYAEGFKSGGFNGRNIILGGAASVTSFQPEEAKTFEVGIKSTLLDNRLTLNASYFNTQYDNIHLTVRVGIAPTVFNGGESSIQGFELESTFVPDDNWLITAGVGYLNAEYDSINRDDFPAGPGINFGVDQTDEFPLSPEWTANVGIAYTQDLGNWILTPRIDWSYTGDKWFDAENNPGAFQDSVHLLNAAVSLDSADDKWSFIAGVTNLTDEVYLTAATDARGTGLGYYEQVFARTREFSLQARYRW